MPKRASKSTKSLKSWKPLQLFQHQQTVVQKYKEGLRRFFLAWHRRAGKDVFGLDFARERMYERIGAYWHLFPYHVQAKRAIWKGIDARTGERFIDRAFPKAIRESDNDTEMSITFQNGSSWQMLGSDNYDRMVGSNPCGVIFSEWALCDPAAWDYIRPILIENKGWAMFITTFRGRNHAYRMFKTIEELEGWYADLRTIEDTYRHDGTPIVSAADVQKEIAEGMDASLAQQEFYCDPNAATTGAIFNKQYQRLLQVDPDNSNDKNRIIRIAWGTHEEGIAAVAFQANRVMGVHTFIESNIVDAVQIVAQRHPHQSLIHHAINPDPALFRHLDNTGIAAVNLSSDPVTMHGHVAAMLNRCEVNSISREKLADFTMNYAPYRDNLDDYDLSHDALCQAVAVMHASQMSTVKKFKRLDYSAYDRGVI